MTDCQVNTVSAQTYAYDHAGNQTSITYPDSAAFTYGYDGMNRFIWGGNSGSNAPVIIGTYHDPLGRVSWVGRNHIGGTAYGYDLADRVTKVQIEAGTGELWSWTYNPAGQVVMKSSSNSAYDQTPANDNEAHTYDGLNRDAAVTAVSGYDANQNLTTDPVGARSFTYDAENKLVAASGSGTSAAVSLSYDPLGRLYQEVATSGGSSTTTQFLYSGDKLVAEYNGAGVMQVRYLHGPAEDQPLIQYGGSSVDGTTAQFLYTDRQGSVVALQNTAGTVQTPFTYGPYGEPASWGGTRFAYTGQIELPEARLYYYKARVYDPARGAFNQTDPIGYKDDLNLYGYVGDDPFNHGDPSGTQSAGPGADVGPATTEDISKAWAALNRWMNVPIATSTASGCVSAAGCSVMAGTLAGNMPVTYTRGDAFALGSIAVDGALAGLGALTKVGGVEFTTVARWMSADEYATMAKTGFVQESHSGTTYVITNGSTDAFKAAPKGSVLAEFSVPSNSLKPTKDGPFEKPKDLEAVH